MTSGRRWGKLVWRGSGGRLEDTCQLGGAHVLLLDVLMLKVMKVKGQVTVKVEVKVFEEVLLFSLSSTPLPRTTPSTAPAGRCLSLGR